MVGEEYARARIGAEDFGPPDDRLRHGPSPAARRGCPAQDSERISPKRDPASSRRKASAIPAGGRARSTTGRGPAASSAHGLRLVAPAAHGQALQAGLLARQGRG